VVDARWFRPEVAYMHEKTDASQPLNQRDILLVYSLRILSLIRMSYPDASPLILFRGYLRCVEDRVSGHRRCRRGNTDTVNRLNAPWLVRGRVNIAWGSVLLIIDESTLVGGPTCPEVVQLI
jgi:hypothetical protein